MPDDPPELSDSEALDPEAADSLIEEVSVAV